MGSGVSTDSKQLAKLEYLVQKKKPIDGSDCLDFDSALIEIGKLRTLCRLLDPQTVEDLLSGQKDDKVTNLEVIPVKESEEKEKEGDPILTLLQEKLDNRLISLREAFQKIDITGSGYITKEEFIQVISPLSLSPALPWAPLTVPLLSLSLSLSLLSHSHVGTGVYNSKKMISLISPLLLDLPTLASLTRPSFRS
jgi:hypothetical protein